MGICGVTKTTLSLLKSAKKHWYESFIFLYLIRFLVCSAKRTTPKAGGSDLQLCLSILYIRYVYCNRLKSDFDFATFTFRLRRGRRRQWFWALSPGSFVGLPFFIFSDTGPYRTQVLTASAIFSRRRSTLTRNDHSESYQHNFRCANTFAATTTRIVDIGFGNDISKLASTPTSVANGLAMCELQIWLYGHTYGRALFLSLLPGGSSRDSSNSPLTALKKGGRTTHMRKIRARPIGTACQQH